MRSPLERLRAHSPFYTKTEEEPTVTMTSEELERFKASINMRIMLTRQKLHGTNLNNDLREKEIEISENQVEVKNIEQELIMTKIEIAMLKCQIDEI